ncbi:replication initiator [Kineococcus terrestris]|uniref:replication initiator n=1 Tax=Kineococcus terrestris TaxID=2044856 RepID=UPI0034DACFEE
MSGPVSLGELLPGAVAEMAARAARPDFDRWQQQAESCGHCSRPIRLRGATETRTADGRLVEFYDTASEPDGVAYVRCGNRRAAVCPSCSHEYKGDMWHLLFAGAAGGIKDVPETVAEHPMVFATFTAPSFGAVHTTRHDPSRGRGARCRPRRDHPRCEHGRAMWCSAVHAEEDPALGTPLCPECYDYGGHVAFNWYAPELWRRFTIGLRRRLADQLGVPRSKLLDVVVPSFAKVAEFQRRGVVHFHALIRLDGPGEGYPAPLLPVSAEELGEAVTVAASEVRVTTAPWTAGAPTWELRFGEQLDVRPVHGAANRNASRGDMHPQMVAAYIAKYATKAAEDFGISARPMTRDDVEKLRVGQHPKNILRAAASIAAEAAATIKLLGEDADALGDDGPDNADIVEDAETWLLLVKWLHMLGFRGHFSTKSRRYSVTLGSLREERRTWRRRREAERGGDALRLLGSDSEEADDGTALVVLKRWSFEGVGWLTNGDAALAASAAARAREHREAARLDEAHPDID